MGKYSAVILAAASATGCIAAIFGPTWFTARDAVVLVLLALCVTAQTFAVGMLGDKRRALAYLLMCLVFALIDFVAFLLVPPLGLVSMWLAAALLFGWQRLGGEKYTIVALVILLVILSWQTSASPPTPGAVVSPAGVGVLLSALCAAAATAVSILPRSARKVPGSTYGTSESGR